jgi:diguanylate cyclase
MATVLIVDDATELVEELVFLLQLEGFDVRFAGDGGEAVRLLKGFRPDIIVSDIMMPQLDGYDFLKVVNSDPRLAGIPFIFLTARDSADDFRRGMSLGADDYLTKPFKGEELVAAIRVRLQRHAAVVATVEASEPSPPVVRSGLDTTTGLPNRRALLLALGAADEDRGGILLVSIDRIDQLENVVGGTAIDAAIHVLVGRLHTVLPGFQLFALDRGRFVAFDAGIHRGRLLRNAAETVLYMLKQPLRLRGEEVATTGSVGCAFRTPAKRVSGALLYQSAESAMLRVRDRGGNGIGFFEDGTSDRSHRIHMESELHLAVSRDEFFMEYQPIVDLSSGRIVRLEALMRWRHPEYGLVPPSEFIPMAEAVGEIDALGIWSLTEALGQLDRWLSDGHDICVSVNVTGTQWSGRVAECVRRALAGTGVASDRLVLEISEFRMGDGNEDFIASLEGLRADGVKVGIGNFGASSSAFVALKNLPVDEVKIDRIFMQGVPGDVADTVICRSILELAKSMNLRSVAEGIETREQLEWVRKQGCNAIQGYFFSAPLAPAELGQVLAEGRRILGTIVVFD